MKTLLFLLIFITTACTQKQQPFAPKDVYHSKTLIITQIAAHSFIHTSFLQTDDFGLVPCNGMVVYHRGEAVIFDTPVDDQSAKQLIKFIQTELRSKIKAIIPTHFHNDCLGSLKVFHDSSITSYANHATTILAKESNSVVPQISFRDSLTLTVGGKTVLVKFMGEGHTKDNIVGYFHEDRVLFGGCLVKELTAGKGFLGDANVDEWPATVGRVKTEFPETSIVIPGHGASGNIELLDYTIQLFKKQ